MSDRQDRADLRSTASDRRQDRSDTRSDVSDERMDLSDARQDATEERMDLGDRRMNTSDRRSDVSETLAKRRHQADLTQRVVVVLTIAVVITILALQSLVLIHVVRLEEENKRLNLRLINQQTLLGELAGEISRATLFAVACAQPAGPETAEQIQDCVDRKTMATK